VTERNVARTAENLAITMKILVREKTYPTEMRRRDRDTEKAN